VALLRAPPERRVSAPVALCVAIVWDSFGWWVFVLLKESSEPPVTRVVFRAA
jgi:hypothetical protein